MSQPISIMFTRRKAFFSRWIQRFTWSPWSHVGLVYGDEVIEALGFKGVTKRPLTEAQAEYSGTLIQVVDCDRPEEAWLAACSQIGKGFDYLSLLGLFFRRDWQDPRRWQCSELLVWAFESTGQRLLRADHLHRIVPRHLFMSIRLRDGT